MTDIYLIRHGQVDNPRKIIYGRNYDLPLSQEGMIQVMSLAVSLERRNVIPSVIISSPLMRALQTADVLSRALGEIPVVSHPGLNEVESEGLEGRPYARTLAPLDWDPYMYKGPLRSTYRIERPKDIARRMVAVINRFVSLYPDGDPLFVSHGDPIAFLFAHLRKPGSRLPSIKEIEEVREYPKKAQARRVRLEGNRMVEFEFISGTELFRGGQERRY